MSGDTGFRAAGYGNQQQQQQQPSGRSNVDFYEQQQMSAGFRRPGSGGFDDP